MYAITTTTTTATQVYEDAYVKLLTASDDPVEELRAVEDRTTTMVFDSSIMKATDISMYRWDLDDGVKKLHACSQEGLYDATQAEKENPIAINDKYLMSDQATEDLIAIAGIGCPATGRIGLTERLRWLHQGLAVRKKIDITAIFRDEKIRAMVTPSYVSLAQSEILSRTKTAVLDKIPDAAFVDGHIGHRTSRMVYESESAAKKYADFLTEVGYTFDEAKVIMEINNSDTGEGAVDFRIGVQTDGGAYIPFEPDARFRMPHKGKASYEYWEEKIAGVPDYLDTELDGLIETGKQSLAYPDTCYANCIKEIGAQGGNAAELAILFAVNRDIKTRYDLIHTLAEGVNYLTIFKGLTPDNQVKFMAGLARLSSPDFNWQSVDIPIAK